MGIQSFASTRSLVLRPQDSRCRWWGKVVTPDAACGRDPAKVAGAGDIPGQYERAGADVEVPVWGAVVTGEANHHRKARGWSIAAALIIPRPSPKAEGEPMRAGIPVGAAVKRAIKATRPDLMGGSGDHAAIVRSLTYILGAAGDSDEARLARYDALVAAGKEA